MGRRYDPKEVARRLAPIRENVNVVSTASVDAALKPLLAKLKSLSLEPKDFAKDIRTLAEMKKMWLEDVPSYFQRDVQTLPVRDVQTMTAEQLRDFWTSHTNYFSPPAMYGHATLKKALRVAGDVVDAFKDTWARIGEILTEVRKYERGYGLLAVEGHLKSLLNYHRSGVQRKTVDDVRKLYAPGTVIADNYVMPLHIDTDTSGREYVRRKVAAEQGREPDDTELEFEYVLWHMRAYTNAWNDPATERRYAEGARSRVKESVSAFVKAMKEVIASRWAGDSPEQVKTWTRELLGREPKRGEVAAYLRSVSRGGNVAGFNVVNEIGLQPAYWEEVGKALATVRDLLSRKGFGFLVPMTKIIIGRRPTEKVFVKATASYLSIGGHYFHKDGSIRIYFDEQNAGSPHDSIVSIVIHEIGHLYYFRALPVPAQARQNTLFSDAKDFVSSYARNNPAEDFAETFAAYISRQYRLPNHEYRMSRDAFSRWKSVIALDPRVRSYDLRAERADADFGGVVD